MADDSLTQPDVTMLMTADDDVFDTPANVDGKMCEVCGKGPYKNMGRHMVVHNDGTAEKVSVPRRIQKDIGGKGAPSVDQLTVASGRLLGYGSIAIASIVVDDDPRPLSDEQKDAIVDALSATPDEAKDIMRPLARIFAGTSLNKRVGRKIVDNMDAADSLVALYMMTRRWGQYMNERNSYVKATQSDPAAPVDHTNHMAVTRAQVHQARIVEQDSKQGVLVTPDMIQSMRGGR